MELLIGLLGQLLFITLAPIGAIIAAIAGAVLELVLVVFAALIGTAAKSGSANRPEQRA